MNLLNFAGRSLPLLYDVSFFLSSVLLLSLFTASTRGFPVAVLQDLFHPFSEAFFCSPVLSLVLFSLLCEDSKVYLLSRFGFPGPISSHYIPTLVELKFSVCGAVVNFIFDILFHSSTIRALVYL